MLYIVEKFANYYRVATNLENMEYSGISLNMENSGNSVQPQRKIVTKYFWFVIQIFGQSAVVTYYIAGVDVE